MARLSQTNQKPDDYKTKQLILHLSHASECDDSFGSVKLNKLLFFADFQAYVRLGKSITGQEYQALEHGPAPRRLVPIRDEMTAEQSLVVVPQKFHGHSQQKPIACQEADLSVFTPQEIALVDDVLSKLRNATATEVSAWSHQFVGWQYAANGETIPYSVALVSNRSPELSEMRYGARLESIAQEFISRAR